MVGWSLNPLTEALKAHWIYHANITVPHIQCSGAAAVLQLDANRANLTRQNGTRARGGVGWELEYYTYVHRWLRQHG